MDYATRILEVMEVLDRGNFKQVVEAMPDNDKELVRAIKFVLDMPFKDRSEDMAIAILAVILTNRTSDNEYCKDIRRILNTDEITRAKNIIESANLDWNL